MNHKHKCPLCNKVELCVGIGKHGEQNVVCEGDYNSPCDRHSVDELTKYCKEEGLI